MHEKKNETVCLFSRALHRIRISYPTRPDPTTLLSEPDANVGYKKCIRTEPEIFLTKPDPARSETLLFETKISGFAAYARVSELSNVAALVIPYQTIVFGRNDEINGS